MELNPIIQSQYCHRLCREVICHVQEHQLSGFSWPVLRTSLCTCTDSADLRDCESDVLVLSQWPVSRSPRATPKTSGSDVRRSNGRIESPHIPRMSSPEFSNVGLRSVKVSVHQCKHLIPRFCDRWFKEQHLANRGLVGK